MTQKRYWNLGDPFDAAKIRQVQYGLHQVGVYRRYDITVVATDTIQIGADGFALLPDGIAVSEDYPVTIRINPLNPTAIDYTITARHTENNQSGGTPVVYAAEKGYLANGSLSNGVVLGWIHYTGGGNPIIQSMIELAPLVNDGVTPGGPAGGDLGGTYPDPTVVGIQTTPVASTTPSTDGDVLLTVGGVYTPTPLATAVGTGIPSANFNILGPSTGYSTPTNYIDGFREFGVPATITKVILSQEVAGSSGSTSVVLYKIDEYGTETQITPTGAIQIPYTAGNKARVVVTTFLSGTNVLTGNDRLGVKVLSLQVGGEDVSVNAIVAGAALPSPTIISANTSVTQSLDTSVFGAVPTFCSSIYLPSGTLIASLTQLVVGAALPADTARIQLRKMGTGTVVFDTTVTGTPTTVSPLSNVVIPSEGFYEWWAWSPSGGSVVFRGFRLSWAAQTTQEINYGATVGVIGTTPIVVGSIYLIAGTMQGSAAVVLDAAGPGAPTAYLEIQKPDTTTLTVFTSSGTGGREVVTLGAPVFVPVSGFYTVLLYGDAVTTSAGFTGFAAKITA